MTRKLIVILAMLVGLVSGTWAAQLAEIKFVEGIVPNYYEYDANENPKHKFWCGHASLKMMADYSLGEYKTLTEIHEAMKLNSSYYRNKKVCGSWYCARLYDIEMALCSSNRGSYHVPKYNVVREDVPNTTTFFNIIKQQILNNRPIIADSRFDVSFGHFYVIVGYMYAKDSVDSINNVTLYLRDSIKSNSIHEKWDTKVKLVDFWKKMNLKQVIYVK